MAAEAADAEAEIAASFPAEAVLGTDDVAFDTSLAAEAADAEAEIAASFPAEAVLGTDDVAFDASLGVRAPGPPRFNRTRGVEETPGVSGTGPFGRGVREAIRPPKVLGW